MLQTTAAVSRNLSSRRFSTERPRCSPRATRSLRMLGIDERTLAGAGRDRTLDAASAARSPDRAQMGLVRQSVQRLDQRYGGRRTAASRGQWPHHRRARLGELTARSRSAYGRASQRQEPWAQRLAKACEGPSGPAAGGERRARGLLERRRPGVKRSAGPQPRSPASSSNRSRFCRPALWSADTSARRRTRGMNSQTFDDPAQGRNAAQRA